MISDDDLSCIADDGTESQMEIKEMATELLNLRAQKRRRETELCDWTYREDEDAWGTRCGARFRFIEGSPSHNGMLYCNFCGRPVNEVQNA